MFLSLATLSVTDIWTADILNNTWRYNSKSFRTIKGKPIKIGGSLKYSINLVLYSGSKKIVANPAHTLMQIIRSYFLWAMFRERLIFSWQKVFAASST